jgi:hypothetical protein
MYEYIITKMVYAEVTKEMVLEARKKGMESILLENQNI